MQPTKSLGGTVSIGLSKEIDLWPRRDEPAVRAELANRFLAFAKSIAVRYRGKAETLDDLVQVASVGLMNAIERFDPDKGIPFVAFASPTIHGELKRHFRDRVSTMKIPRSVNDRIGQMDSVVADLRTALSHEPTSDEIAAAMSCSTDDVLEAREATQTRNPIGFGSGADDDDRMTEDHLGTVDAGYEKSEDRIVAAEAFEELDPDSREIVIMRFRDEMTQNEIADRLGCSQMQVSRKIRAILERMSQAVTSPTGP